MHFILKKVAEILMYLEENKYNLFDFFVHSSFWLTAIVFVRNFALLEMQPKKVLKSNLEKFGKKE